MQTEADLANLRNDREVEPFNGQIKQGFFDGLPASLIASHHSGSARLRVTAEEFKRKNLHHVAIGWTDEKCISLPRNTGRPSLEICHAQVARGNLAMRRVVCKTVKGDSREMRFKQTVEFGATWASEASSDAKAFGRAIKRRTRCVGVCLLSRIEPRLSRARLKLRPPLTVSQYQVHGRTMRHGYDLETNLLSPYSTIPE
jgi:hypothetical protein